MCAPKEKLDVNGIQKADEELSKDEVNVDKSKLELAILLISFGSYLSSTIFEIHLVNQTCSSVFAFNKSICDAVTSKHSNNTPELTIIKDNIQEYASNIILTESLIQAIIPAFIGLFLGAWSDKFGRKPILLAACVGYFSCFIIKAIIAIISVFTSVNPWIYIAASIPLSLSGGGCVVMIASFSYLVEVNPLIERPFRICVVGGMIPLGMALGQLLSGLLYGATNAIFVFAVSALFEVLAILFIMFIVEESAKEDQLPSSTKLPRLGAWTFLQRTLKAIFKRRPYFDRGTTWCIAIAVALIAFASAGELAVFQSFILTQFKWTTGNFGIFSGVSGFLYALGAGTGIIFMHKKLHCSMIKLALMGIACFVINAAITAAAVDSWQIYLSVALSVFQGIAVPMCRGILSNVIPSSDIGKVFALVAALEVTVVLGSAPLYNYLYNSMLETCPGAFNLVSVVIYILSFILVGFVFLMESCYQNIKKTYL